MPNVFSNIFAIPQVDAAPRIPTYNPTSGLAALIQVQNAIARQARAAAGRVPTAPGQYKGVGDPSKGRWVKVPGEAEPKWAVGTTEKERDAAEARLVNEARMRIIQANPEFTRRLEGFAEKSLPAQREALDGIRKSGVIAQMAPQLGMTEAEAAKLLLDGPASEIEARQKAVDAASTFGGMVAGIRDRTVSAIEALGKSAEEQAAIGRRDLAAEERRINENALRDEERRLEKERRSTLGLWLSNPLDMTFSKAGPIVATAVPQMLGAGLGFLVGGPAGAAAGAMAGGGISSAMYGAGDMLQRAVSDPNLTPEQQAQAAHEGYYTGGGISGAIGALPYGPFGLAGKISANAASKSFSVVAPKMLGAQLGKEQGAARLAEYVATKEGQKAQQAVLNEVLARRALEHGAARRIATPVLGTAADAAGLGVAWQLGQNQAYNQASGQDLPLTEGITEQGIAGGLLGAMFGLKGAGKRLLGKQPSVTQNPEAKKAYDEWAVARSAETPAPENAPIITPPSDVETSLISAAQRNDLPRTIANLLYGGNTLDEITATASRVFRDNPVARDTVTLEAMRLQTPPDRTAPLQNILKSGDVLDLSHIISEAHANGYTFDEIKDAIYKAFPKNKTKLNSAERELEKLQQTATPTATQAPPQSATAAIQTAPPVTPQAAPIAHSSAPQGAPQVAPTATPTVPPQGAPAPQAASGGVTPPVVPEPTATRGTRPQPTPRPTAGVWSAASTMGAKSPFTAALTQIASGASPAQHHRRVLDQTLALSSVDAIPTTVNTLLNYAGHTPEQILKSARKVLKNDPQKQQAVVQELMQRLQSTSAAQQAAAGRALRTTLLPKTQRRSIDVNTLIKGAKKAKPLRKALVEKLKSGETTPDELEAIAQSYGEKSWQRKTIHAALAEYSADQAAIANAASAANPATEARNTGVLKVPNRPDEPFTYELMEADDVQASHLPEAAFQKNPRYQLENERRYHDEPNSQAAVLNRAQELDPGHLLTNTDASTGAPVTDEAGNVLGGNGRLMSIRHAYDRVPARAQAYKDALFANASQLGLDPAQVATMERPVLVRKLTRAMGPQEKQTLVSALNDSFTNRTTRLTDSKSRGDRFTPSTLTELAYGLEDADSLRKYFDTADSTRVVEKLVDDGVILPTERNVMVDRDGLLTPEGKQHVEQALRGRVFKNYEALAGMPVADLAKIDAAIPHVLIAESKGAKWNITKHLSDAADLMAEYTASDFKKPEPFMKQTDIVKGGAPIDRYSQPAQRLFHMLLDTNKKDFVNAFAKYAGQAKLDGGLNLGLTPAEAGKKFFGFERSNRGTDGQTAHLAANERPGEGAANPTDSPTNRPEPVNPEAAAATAADQPLAEARNGNPEVAGRGDVRAEAPNPGEAEALAAASRGEGQERAPILDGESSSSTTAAKRTAADSGERSLESETSAGAGRDGDGADAGRAEVIDPEAYRAEAERILSILRPAKRETPSEPAKTAPLATVKRSIDTLPNAADVLVLGKKALYPDMDYPVALEKATDLMQRAAAGETLSAGDKLRYEQLKRLGIPDVAERMVAPDADSMKVALETLPNAAEVLKKAYPRKTFDDAVYDATELMAKKALGEPLNKADTKRYNALKKAGAPDMEVNVPAVDDAVAQINKQGLTTTRVQWVMRDVLDSKRRTGDPNSIWC